MCAFEATCRRAVAKMTGISCQIIKSLQNLFPLFLVRACVVFAGVPTHMGVRAAVIKFICSLAGGVRKGETDRENE